MQNPAIRLYNALKARNFNDEEAASIVEDIEQTVDRKFENNAERFATKADIRELKDSTHSDMVKLKDSINSDMMKLKDSMNDTVNDLFWKIIFSTTTLILGQMGLIFLILKLVGVFDNT